MSHMPRLKEIIVRRASDLSGTLDSTVVYIIDGSIDMGSTSIKVPQTGLNIRGYGFGVSKLTSSTSNATLFTTDGVNYSGDLFLGGLEIEITGTGSKVFDLDNQGNFNAVEMDTVNFNNCTSLGVLDSYRQGLEINTGRFGGTPNLELVGAWVGGYRITTSIVRSLSSGMTGALFEAGTGFVMSSRFLTDINCDLPASAAFCDFSTTNMPNASTLQVNGAIFTRNGVSNPSDTNIFPNISTGALSSFFRDNQGVENTNVGGRLTISTEAVTTISAANTWYTLAGTWASASLQHFDSPAAGQLRNLGTTPIEYRFAADLTIDSNQGDVLEVRLRRYNSATADFTDLDFTSQRRQVNNLAGGRDVAFFGMLNNVVLLENDYVYLQVNNNTDSNNCTLEDDSYWFLEAR